MVTLMAISAYTNREHVYRPGEQFQVNDETALFLEADAPGVFKRIEAAPVDKMVKRPAMNKAIKASNG